MMVAIFVLVIMPATYTLSLIAWYTIRNLYDF